MRVSDGGGPSIPPGDPGAIRGAAGQLSGLAGQITGIRSQSRGAASELVGQSWNSPAASVFQAASGRYASDLSSLEAAVTSAAAALRVYAAALESAQQQARAAIAAQSQAETAAADALTKLSSNTPPSGASAAALATFQQQQAQASTTINDTMSQAVNSAGTRLGAAFTQASAAAGACAGALNAAAGQMAPLAHRAPSGKVATGVDASKSWAETFSGWFEKASHENDFLGAAAVSFIHQYEQAAERAGQSSLAVLKNLPQDEAGVLAVLSGDAQVDGLEKAGQDFDAALSAAGNANNPLVKLLTKGLVDDDGSMLAKVPILGLVFTAGAIGLDFAEGKSPAAAVGVPVANLAIGTAAAEGMGALLASDAVAPILASLAIPGVGEAVLAGAAAIAVTYAVDQGATWVWDHRAAIGHSIESAVGAVVSVDESALQYGQVAYDKTVQVLGSATTWAVTHGEQELATLGNQALSLGSGALSNAEAMGSTLLHTGGTALHTLEGSYGTAVNDLGSAASTAVHYAEPWNWGL
jgi:uncharacterized protein YukE